MVYVPSPIRLFGLFRNTSILYHRTWTSGDTVFMLIMREIPASNLNQKPFIKTSYWQMSVVRQNKDPVHGLIYSFWIFLLPPRVLLTYRWPCKPILRMRNLLGIWQWIIFSLTGNGVLVDKGRIEMLATKTRPGANFVFRKLQMSCCLFESVYSSASTRLG